MVDPQGIDSSKISLKEFLRASDLSGNIWSKSELSGGGGASSDCVEVARIVIGGAVAGYAMRDSSDPDGPKLYWTPSEYKAFTRGVLANQENLLPID
ncbi:DUF397 domain-containing protein [Kitasatospora sp. NPDC094011]|uniref:DUF397 domain-containing protein n=1 Tax=Kitasatospora sp. NPDC094011 TaxID=3364090 RepID=UPI0038084BF5